VIPGAFSSIDVLFESVYAKVVVDGADVSVGHVSDLDRKVREPEVHDLVWCDIDNGMMFCLKLKSMKLELAMQMMKKR
jgi:hypothetical protein